MKLTEEEKRDKRIDTVNLCLQEIATQETKACVHANTDDILVYDTEGCHYVLTDLLQQLRFQTDRSAIVWADPIAVEIFDINE